MSLHNTKMINTGVAIALLIFLPSKLVEYSVDHAVRSQSGALTPERELELRQLFERQFSDTVSLTRSLFFTSFAVVAGSIAAAVLSGALLKALSVAKSAEWNAWLQYGGIGILLWATLAKAGSAIRTLDGGTLPERVDVWLHRLLYVAGSYALALSVAW